MTSAATPPRPLRLLAWLGGLIAAIAVLTLVGRGPLAAPPLDPSAWWAWAGQRDPAVVVIALLRLLTLMLAWYLLGATAISVVARLHASTHLVAFADLLTLPPVRRLLQGALGVGFATAAALGSASAPPTAPGVGTAPVAVQVTAEAIEMVPVGDEAAVLLPVPEPTPAQTAEPGSQQRMWVVQPGDHFWSIAEQVLSQAWGRGPSAEEVTPYWERLVEVNRGRLVDRGNPDFIRPGDRFVVPPPLRPARAAD